MGKSYTLLERLERNSMPEPNSGCLLWTAGCNAMGYGLMRMGSRKTGDRCFRYAHRIAFTALHGREPADILRHKCDTPACINVAHLEEGSRADNARDRVARGRQARGERAGGARLSTADVRTIRAPSKSRAELAAMFGISVSQVRRIILGSRWAHVAGEEK